VILPVFPRCLGDLLCQRLWFRVLTLGWSELLAGSCVNVEHKRLENCAHCPPLEDGACFGRLLDDFMSEHDIIYRVGKVDSRVQAT
jgi:hypothetical protein